MSDNYVNEDKSDVFGVAYQCPAGERVEDCPLKDFDKLSFKERVDKIYNMSKEDVEKIIEYHRNCSKHRGRRLIK